MLRIGVVASFDGRAGLGSVRGDDGRELFFHATQIAGGGRSIDPGTRVAFAVTAGNRGRWEARAVTPL